MENGAEQSSGKTVDDGPVQKMETNKITNPQKNSSKGAPGLDSTASRQSAANFRSKNKKETYFIAIHLGAGKHSMRPKSVDQYKKLCQEACSKALVILEAGGNADDAVIAATIVLEDSELLNAGTGSELNSEGKVECDAGYMSGSGYFGGVGAIPGCPNPTLVARKLAQLNLTRQNLIPGAVPPIILTGIGARDWAISQDIPVCDDQDLITDRTRRAYDRIVELASDYKANRKRKHSGTSLYSEDGVNSGISDTIGAIALDINGHVAATVSTGGNQLKLPGRIGHVPIFGCGCWAADQIECNSGAEPAIAVSTTGVGEMMVKMHWASECASCILSENHDTPMEAMKFAIQKKFLESPLLRHHTEPKIVGGIALLWDGRHGELIYGFHAQTFVFAFAGDKFTSPEVNILTASSPTDVVVGCQDF